MKAKKLKAYDELEIVTFTTDGKVPLRRFKIRAKKLGGIKKTEMKL